MEGNPCSWQWYGEEDSKTFDKGRDQRSWDYEYESYEYYDHSSQQSCKSATNGVRMRKPFYDVYVCEFGECYHTSSTCRGLLKAKKVKSKRMCQYCAANDDSID